MSVNFLRMFSSALIGNEISKEHIERFKDESLCRRCGICCYGAIFYKGRWIVLFDLPCRFLEKDENGLCSCSIYERRYLASWCQHVTIESVKEGLFPNDCPYVYGIKHYKGKEVISGEEFQRIVPGLRKVFKDYPKPDYISTKTWNHFLVSVLGIK